MVPVRRLSSALDGLPVAVALRLAIDAMWASDGLPRRTRALLCVIIARALGCSSSEADAVALLSEEGVDPTTIDGVLYVIFMLRGARKPGGGSQESTVTY